MKNVKLAPEIEALHDQACAKNEDFYIDPITTLIVTTKIAHLKRGYCCNSNCRHCPFDKPKPN